LFEVDPPEKRYDHGKDVQLHRRLEQDFAALPGVEGATPINNPYISDGLSSSDFIPEGAADDGHHSGAEDFNITGNTFFQTFGIPIIAGRGFGAQDTASSQKVAVINQALAKKRFPNGMKLWASAAIRITPSCAKRRPRNSLCRTCSRRAWAA
jgi:hypothetical protein